MAQWDDNDWRIPSAREFCRIAHSLQLRPSDQNSLIRMMHIIVNDQTYPQSLRDDLNRICLQSQKQQATFLVGAVKRYWPVAVPQIGLTSAEDRKAANTTAGTINVSSALQPAVESGRPAPSVPVVPKAAIQILKPKIVESVISLQMKALYNPQQVGAVLSEWVLKSVAEVSFTVTQSVGFGKTIDLWISTDCSISRVFSLVSQLNWIESCFSKPCSDFGQFWACAE